MLVQLKSSSSPNSSIGDPWFFNIWIPDYTLGNDNLLRHIEQLLKKYAGQGSGMLTKVLLNSDREAVDVWEQNLLLVVSLVH